MILLDTTGKSVEVSLDDTPGTELPWTASYVDITASTFVPLADDGVTNGTTAVTVVAAPAASTQRQVKFLSVHNVDTESRTITVQLNSSAVRSIFACSLAPGESLHYIDTDGFKILTANGGVKTSELAATQYFDAYDAAGGVAIDTGGAWTPITLDTTRAEDQAFAHTAGQAEVVINVEDTYVVFGRVTTDVLSGTDRTQAEMKIELDPGTAVWEDVPGTVAEMYARTLDNGEATGSAFAVLTLSVGHRLRLSCKRDAGTNALQTHHDGSGLMVMRLRGEKGDTGAAGATQVFGADLQTANSDGTSNTTDTSYQTKLQLVTAAVTGTYRIAWHSVISQSDNSESVQARLHNLTDDEIMGTSQRMEPKDSDDKVEAGGFYYLTFTGVAKTFEIQYRVQGTGTATIRDASIEFWRVS